jgi:hypothetical protein
MDYRLFINQEKSSPITWKLKIGPLGYIVQIIDYNSPKTSSEDYSKEFEKIEELTFSIDNLIKELKENNFTEFPLKDYELDFDIDLIGEIKIAIPAAQASTKQFLKYDFEIKKTQINKILSLSDSFKIKIPPMKPDEFFTFDSMTYNQGGCINNLGVEYVLCEYEKDMATTFSNISKEITNNCHLHYYESDKTQNNIIINLKEGFNIRCSPPKIYKRSDFVDINFLKDSKLPAIVKQVHRQEEKNDKIHANLEVSIIIIKGYISIINTDTEVMKTEYPNI